MMVVVLGVVLAATRTGFCRVDSHRVHCLLLCAHASSSKIRCCSQASTLRGVRRPNGGLNAELLCVLGVQSLPAVEVHGFVCDDASDGVTGDKPLQHTETH